MQHSIFYILYSRLENLLWGISSGGHSPSQLTLLWFTSLIFIPRAHLHVRDDILFGFKGDTETSQTSHLQTLGLVDLGFPFVSSKWRTTDYLPYLLPCHVDIMDLSIAVCLFKSGSMWVKIAACYF